MSLFLQAGLVLAGSLGVLPALAQTKPAIVHLRCEYLVNPLGIDAVAPRLSWQLADSRPGAQQLAYSIRIGTDSLALSQGKPDQWNSGKRVSASQLVYYSGPGLRPFTRYFWKLSIWMAGSPAPVHSDIAAFETGFLNQPLWQGAWISDSRDIHQKAAPYFRYAFKAGKKIKSARAYIAAAGLYELFLNGNRIGNHRLDPMYTRFDRRNLYVSHDVTAAIQNGENVIGVLLGNGWYNHQSTAVWYFHEAPWRSRPAFCLDLRITYTDGSIETISSNKSWKTQFSPVVFNSIYTAEHYDARNELPGWNQPGYADSSWKPVLLRSAPSQQVITQALHPIRQVDSLKPVQLKKFSDSNYVFDLGRNIAGISELRVSGPRGTIIRLKHGERLYPNGHVDLSNIDVHYRPTDDQDPFQTDIYTLKGTGVEVFAPRFNYKGFQYVELNSSLPLEITQSSLSAYFMHSDVPAIGSIKSDNSTINKIWAATNNSYLANLFGYPTDCPQREKNGWTGDAHIAVETGLYNFDGITIYEKWMADHRDEQQPNGVLPSIIPTDGWGYEWGNGPDWTSTIALIPWNLYLFYGDTQTLSRCYDNIKRYVDHIEALYPSGITSWGLGDWVPVKSQTPVPFTSTAYYYTDVSILAAAAGILGKAADNQKYGKLANTIKQAFHQHFYNAQTGLYGSGLQTELSVALHWGLVPDSLRNTVAANLAKRVKADGTQLDVGLLGTKAILNALSDNGYGELAWKLASRKEFPGWGWWMENGATTLYENWPINASSDISMNHIMFGEIGAWLFKGPGGIRPDPAAPGFRHIRLTPLLLDSVDRFEARHQSPFGWIESGWHRTNGVLQYEALIPPGSRATLILPQYAGTQLYCNGKPINKGKANYQLQLTAGRYRYEWKP